MTRPKALRSYLLFKCHSFVRPRLAFLRPDLRGAERHAQAPSRMAAGHRRRRRAASLMVPSMALGWREGRAICQHPMHDDGELAGERDLGLVHAGALGDAHRPGL